MTSGAPWSVKGIDPKAREIAKDLARRSGMTLGEWLNQMIFDDGVEPEGEIEDGDETPRRAAPAPVRPATESRPPRRGGDDLDRVLAAIDELSGRLEGAEARQAQSASRFETALGELRTDQAQVTSRLEAAEQAGPASGGGASRPETLRALEGALGQIATHVQDGERRNREAVALLRRELSTEVQRVSDQLIQKTQETENRSADAITQVGAEVTRVASVVEQRLRRADDSQAEALEKLGAEIARITERLSERIAAAERRSAQAIDDVGEQMARVTDRIHQRQERSSSELADRMRQSEERTAKLLEEAREKLERRLSKRDGGEVTEEANAFAARWSGDEHAAPEFVPPYEPETKAEPHEATPAFLEPPTLGVDALLANIDLVLDEQILHSPSAFTRPEPPTHLFGGHAEPGPAFMETPAFIAAAAAAPTLTQPHAAFDETEEDEHPEPHLGASELLAPHESLDDAEDLRPSTRDLIAAARASARVHVDEPPVFKAPDFKSPEFKAPTFGEDHEGDEHEAHDALADDHDVHTTTFTSVSPRKARMSGAMRGVLLTGGAVAAIGLAATTYVALNPDALATLKSVASPKTAEASKPPVGPASAPAAPQQAMGLTTPKPAPEGPQSDAEAMFLNASARVDASDASGVGPLKTAANMGYAPAQRRLGKLYEDGGAGVPKDEAEGRSWTQRAAANGDSRAMHNLGLDYYEGVGGIKNMAVAAKWFQRAAELGLRDSQYNLARFYEAGLGVKQDLPSAYKWYLIAARAGDTEAAARGESMKAQLSPEVRAGVEKTAQAFSPDKPAPPSSMTAALKSSTPQQLALAQRALAKLGYYKGQDDGAASQSLGEAIQSYQRDRGLAANGTLSPELIKTFANVSR